MKTFATLMIGAALLGATPLLGAAPAFADNSIDVIQTGGGFNSIDATQKGRDNDFASSQDGFANSLKVKQRGRNNAAGAFQNGLFNDVEVDQRRRRR